MTAYILSDSSIIKLIEKSLKKEITIDIFIYKDNQRLQNSYKLLKLYNIYPDLKLHWISDFLHSKVLISDKERLMIGSANLTTSGLHNNYELGVIIEDNEIAYKMEKLIRRLE